MLSDPAMACPIAHPSILAGQYRQAACTNHSCCLCVVLALKRELRGGDTDSLTPHDIASEATWADKYRDSDRNGTGERYRRARQWHFVDIELDNPNLAKACHNHPRLPSGILASRGPADACIVDKIDEFEAELAKPRDRSGRAARRSKVPAASGWRMCTSRFTLLTITMLAVIRSRWP